MIVDPKAAKELEKLPNKVSHRLFKKVQESKSNPQFYWIKLIDREDYKLRVGDYRALADIYSKQKTIHVTKVGHRKDIYKK